MTKKHPKRKRLKRNVNKYFYLFACIIGLSLSVSCSDNKTKANLQSATQAKPFEPSFTKEGELTFWEVNGKDEIKKIDIEVARTEEETSRGMMFRRNVADTTGMLFIMPVERQQSFFMKNTLISLDIIYVNSQQRIVDIYKNAVPKSEESLPSSAPAKFVVEVVGGFCDKYGVKEGDYVTFQGPGL